MFCFVLPSHFTFPSLWIGFLLVGHSSEADYRCKLRVRHSSFSFSASLLDTHAPTMAVHLQPQILSFSQRYPRIRNRCLQESSLPLQKHQDFCLDFQHTSFFMSHMTSAKGKDGSKHKPSSVPWPNHCIFPGRRCFRIIVTEYSIQIIFKTTAIRTLEPKVTSQLRVQLCVVQPAGS